jgi:CheY-like chemotaxis protein
MANRSRAGKRRRTLTAAGAHERRLRYWDRCAGCRGACGGGEHTVWTATPGLPDVGDVERDVDLGWGVCFERAEATRRIKARERAPVVIMFTLEDTESIRAAAKAAGADDFVAKVPEAVDGLRAAIRRAFPRGEMP